MRSAFIMKLSKEFIVMKKIMRILMISMLVVCQHLQAFVLMGPTAGTDENTLTFTWGNRTMQSVQSANLESGMQGTPKDNTRFFRLNTPYLTYGFDQSFMQYFGSEGVEAIDDAMGVINDFFQPKDGTYDGVSSLDLTRHGFSRNFATYWENQTAKNENLLDIKNEISPI